jgi:RNA polymerase sigma-70 factor (ECF subfamily)
MQSIRSTAWSLGHEQFAMAGAPMRGWLAQAEPLTGRSGGESGADGGQEGSDLIVRAQAGDGAALDRLCRENWLPVYRSVCRLASTPAQAEDLTQEVFVRAIRALSRYPEGDVPYRAYLLRIARNLLIDEWRKGLPSLAEGREPPDLADLGQGPEATAIARDEHRRLLAALDRLPDPYSDVLRLRILEDRTAAQVGALLGQSANAIRQLQHRALAALRRELAKEAGEDR